MRDFFVQAVPFENQLFMVHAQKMQDGGVPVLNAHAILHRAKANIIGLSMNHAALHSPAGHPAGKTTGAVVTPRLGEVALCHR